MTKEQFLEKLGWSALEAKDLEADPAIHEIAKFQEAKSQPAIHEIAKVQEVNSAINSEFYEMWKEIRKKNRTKEDWIKKNSETKTNSIIMTKEQFLNKWVVISAVKDKMLPDLEAVIATEIEKGQEVKPTEQPQMTEKEKIDHILTNKLTWKPMGNKRFYANMIGGKSSEGSRQVCFVDYNNPHSGYFETRIFNIDLSEWQPVEAEQPSSQGKLDNSFDKERFERMFCSISSRGYSKFENIIKDTQEYLQQLDAYYAEKEKGGNNE